MYEVRISKTEERSQRENGGHRHDDADGAALRAVGVVMIQENASQTLHIYWLAFS